MFHLYLKGGQLNNQSGEKIICEARQKVNQSKNNYVSWKMFFCYQFCKAGLNSKINMFASLDPFYE